MLEFARLLKSPITRLLMRRRTAPPSPDPFRQWLTSLAGRCQIHPSLEVSGVTNGFEFVRVGTDVTVERDVTIWVSSDDGARPDLHLSDRVFVGRNTYLGVFQPIRIGESVLIGAYSYLISASHVYTRRDVPIRDQGFAGGAIVIGDDVWLGTHVVVLPGVTIGKGAIVAAGSVVNRDIPPYEVWGGTPARFLKLRPGGAS